MAIINLKEFYPWYTHDEYIEVSDEVAAELRADKLYEAAHQRRIVRNKAQYRPAHPAQGQAPLYQRTLLVQRKRRDPFLSIKMDVMLKCGNIIQRRLI